MGENGIEKDIPAHLYTLLLLLLLLSLLPTTNNTHRSVWHLFQCYLLLTFFRTVDKTCQAACSEDVNLTSDGALLPFALYKPLSASSDREVINQ